MAIYDCFTFFNELDLLEVRLHELDEVVDVFVLAESTATFQGHPKPLYFDRHKDRFARFLPRIRHLVFDGLYDTPTAWQREFAQRNVLARGFADAEDDDRIIIADLDEVPRATTVAALPAAAAFSFLAMRTYYYYMDWLSDVRWPLPYAATAGYLRDRLPDLNTPRLHYETYVATERLDPARSTIEDAGWHLSWLGGVDRILTKLASFSHTEEAAQRWATREKVEGAIGEARFFGDHHLRPVAIDTLPAHVADHADRFRRDGYLAPVPGSAVTAPAG